MVARGFPGQKLPFYGVIRPDLCGENLYKTQLCAIPQVARLPRNIGASRSAREQLTGQWDQDVGIVTLDQRK
jgi:hypothetical protein